VKILHYHEEILLEQGGVVRALLDLCSVLVAAGHDVTLLTFNDADTPERWKLHDPGHPQVVSVPRPSLRGRVFRSAAMQAMSAHLRNADVLHLHGMWDPHHVQLAAAARKLGLPYVYTVHGMLDDWCMAQRGLKKRLYLALFGRRMLHAAAAVHCTAQAELDQSRKWFPQGRGVVVPLLLDLGSFKELPGPGPARARFPQLETDWPTLLFLGRLHYKKGVELLIRAADWLRQDRQDCLVLIAGSGEHDYEVSLKHLTRQLELEDRVHFLGFLSGVEKISLFQAADVFVLPTSQENFGFVLFEALAAMTPVVTTRGPDTWPELQASGGAVIVDRDADAIAEAARAILNDPGRREVMGRAGRDWVFKNLSGGAVVKKIERLYAEAIASARPACS
jgi:glycosyltransferase involved in cell wall biosynthesis